VLYDDTRRGYIGCHGHATCSGVRDGSRAERMFGDWTLIATPSGLSDRRVSPRMKISNRKRHVTPRGGTRCSAGS